MGIFKDKKSISRHELSSIIVNSSGRIPKSPGKKYSREERKKLVNEAFPNRYGHEISIDDYRSALSSLEELKNKTKDISQKKEIDEKIRFLKDIEKKTVIEKKNLRNKNF